MLDGEPLIQCDRCKQYSKLSSYHSRVILKGGFNDIAKQKRGVVITVKDLCARCEQELVAFLDREPNDTEQMEL